MLTPVGFLPFLVRVPTPLPVHRTEKLLHQGYLMYHMKLKKRTHDHGDDEYDPQINA